MGKVLILFAHPRLETSRSNKALIQHLPKSDDLTFHDLYDHYPHFNIDVGKEKDLLLRHNIIIWQHPFYWYSAPPLIKQWIDMVLEFGWAYGPGGTALKGKIAFNAITSGGPRDAYSKEGHHKFSLMQFLTPFNRTTTLCHMTYLPPFAVQGTHRLTDAELMQHAEDYRALLQKFLKDDYDTGEMQQAERLNDIMRPVNHS